MATAGSAERPGRPASAAGRSRPGSRPGAGRGAACSPREDEVKKCPACSEAQPGGSSPPCGHPACPLCPARSSSSEERFRRRSDPERSSSTSGKRDCDSRRGRCVYWENHSSRSAAAAAAAGCLFLQMKHIRHKQSLLQRRTTLF